MYSNGGSRFNVLDILLKVIFAALFIFILIWLFNTKMPNLTTFYSSVFRENIKYMQEAGESYFTNDKLPTEVGDTNKITLADMFDKKYILPFVDKDGNSCNQYDSYVSITKVDDGYELKTNLVCNSESNYTIKKLGCHTYCSESVNCNCNCNCNCGNETKTTCDTKKITQYQFKKLVTTTKTNYSCPTGYKLVGKKCTKTTLVDTISAEITKKSTETVLEDAKLVVVNGTKVEVDVVKTKAADKKEKVYVNAVSNTSTKKEKVYVNAVSSTSTKKEKVYVNAVSKKTGGETTSKQVAYDCSKTKYTTKCKTYYKQVAYNCNCTSSVGSTGKTITKCSTCYKSVPKESCSTVPVTYTDTCYRNETSTTPVVTTYSCPSNTTSEGSGSSLKCYYYKTVNGETIYSCPSNTTSEGSGSNLKCYYYKTVKGETTYSCPVNATNYEGSGSNLKCYKVTKGTAYYTCPTGYTLNKSNNKCYTTKEVTKTVYECPTGYKLDGTKCYKYDTDTKNATAKKVASKSYKYKWSSSKSIKGWTSTGKTKTVTKKVNCKKS